MLLRNKKNYVIYLSVMQLIALGIHIGHIKKQSVFLAGWMFLYWRNNIFILNVIKTFLNMKVAILSIKKVVRYRRPIWFITLNTYYGPLLSRYASICGEPFNTYAWIGGTISNHRRILGWHKLLLRLLKKNKFIFRYMNKRQIASFYGLINFRKRAPGLCFMPTVLDNIIAVEECVSRGIISIVIVDSNTVSGDVFIPLPGNNKSLYSINFFSYFFSRLIYLRKLFNILFWRKKLKYFKKLKTIKKKFIILNFLKKKKKTKIELNLWLSKFNFLIKKAYIYNSERKTFQNEVKRNYYVNDSVYSITSKDFFDKFYWVSDDNFDL